MEKMKINLIKFKSLLDVISNIRTVDSQSQHKTVSSTKKQLHKTDDKGTI